MVHKFGGIHPSLWEQSLVELQDTHNFIMVNPLLLKKVLLAQGIIQEHMEAAFQACYEGGAVKKLSESLCKTLNDLFHLNGNTISLDYGSHL